MPLHDACWSAEPQFDIVRLHLEHDDTLFMTEDKRGWTPLCYIKPCHWPLWNAFFDTVKEKYWPQQQSDSEASAAGFVSCESTGSLSPERAGNDSTEERPSSLDSSASITHELAEALATTLAVE